MPHLLCNSFHFVHRLSIPIVQHLTSSASGGRSRADLLLVCVGDNLSRKVQPFSEVFDTLLGKRVVVVLPRKSGLHESTGIKGLESLDDLYECKSRISILHYDYNHRLNKIAIYLQTSSWCRSPRAYLDCSPSSRQRRPLLNHDGISICRTRCNT